MAKLSSIEVVDLIAGALKEHALAQNAALGDQYQNAAEAVARKLARAGALVIRNERRHRAADSSFRAIVQRLRRNVLG